MGRFSHENVAFMTNTARRVAFYMGDDSTPGCIYKFVPDRAYSDSNRSANATLHAVSDPARRTLLQGGLGATLAALFAPLSATLAGCATPGGSGPRIGFKSVPVSRALSTRILRKDGVPP